MDLAHDAGVEFIFGATVEQINTKSNQAHGICLEDGNRIDADVVLANADLPYVYQHLLPRDRMTKVISHKSFSDSAISFFWGVGKRYPDLGAHTLFIADDFRENFESIQNGRGLHTNPSLYIHAPARLDPAMAPVGQDTLAANISFAG